MAVPLPTSRIDVKFLTFKSPRVVEETADLDYLQPPIIFSLISFVWFILGG